MLFSFKRPGWPVARMFTGLVWKKKKTQARIFKIYQFYIAGKFLKFRQIFLSLWVLIQIFTMCQKCADFVIMSSIRIWEWFSLQSEKRFWKNCHPERLWIYIFAPKLFSSLLSVFFASANVSRPCQQYCCHVKSSSKEIGEENEI